MRGFLLGLVLVVAITFTILSICPGGIRRQLRFAARRLRIFLVLGGVYLVAAAVIRIAFPSGPVADYGPAAVAIVLGAIFLIVGQDPVRPAPGSSPTSRAP